MPCTEKGFAKGFCRILPHKMQTTPMLQEIFLSCRMLCQTRMLSKISAPEDFSQQRLTAPLVHRYYQVFIIQAKHLVHDKHYCTSKLSKSQPPKQTVIVIMRSRQALQHIVIVYHLPQPNPFVKEVVHHVSKLEHHIKLCRRN